MNPTASEATDDCLHQALEELDAVADGWLLLLPDSKKHVLSKDGGIDELMFQAHMALHS